MCILSFCRYVVPKARSDCSKGEQLVVTFAAGYIAGVFCAIVSHPADTIVSKLNQDKSASFMGVAKNLGWAGKCLVQFSTMHSNFIIVFFEPTCAACIVGLICIAIYLYSFSLSVCTLCGLVVGANP